MANNSIRFLGAAMLVALVAQTPVRSATAEHVVTMANMSYGRVPAGIKVGDTITWVNNDTVIHTVTARDHSFDLRIPAGKSARMVAAKAGSFPFYCIFHSAMRGTLTVSAS